MRPTRLLTAVCGLFLAVPIHSADSPDPTSVAPKKEKEEAETAVFLDAFVVSAGAGAGMGGSLGATPGGFQDVNFGRHLLAWGLLPRAEEITAEGLFSEFDLPTPHAPKPAQLLAITGDAKAAGILNRPEITHLAQIGFASGLDARTWRRDPLALVAVADVSGSMRDSLALLKDSLHAVVAKLGPDDAFALVSFSDAAVTELEPLRVTSENLGMIAAAIDRLAIRGGTNIEAGLKRGFELAHRNVEGVRGRRRALLITDAMPNIAATSPASFMGMAEEASLQGTGLTTIGVGLDFSAEFVKRVSSVSGGNACYFADAGQMRTRIAKDFDFMVTELAFDVQIRIEPAAGFQLKDVYGLPGDVFERTPEGGLVMDLPTLFLSRDKGAIFVSFAADNSGATGGPGGVLGRASLSYVLYGGAAPERSAFDLVVQDERHAGLGLRRGELLVNEVEALRAASTAFYDDGDVRAALAQTDALVAIFATERDAAMRKERELLENVAAFLDHAAEDPVLDSRMLRARPEASPLLGVWRFSDESENTPSRFLVLMPGGRAGLLDAPDDGEMRVVRWKGRRLGQEQDAAATLAVVDAQLRYRVMRRGAGATEWSLTRCAPADLWWDGSPVRVAR